MTASANIRHIAIIMDGNGRWAQRRGRPRVWGHVRGSSKVSEIVETVVDIPEIKSLTLFAFSTENWNRPSSEVNVLFFLLRKYIQKERERIVRNNIRFKVIGKYQKLPGSTQQMISDLEKLTENNRGLHLNFAFDYGGRDEIVASANLFISNNPGKALSEEDLTAGLCTVRSAQMSDIDLLIRTGGDQRISNFLLWQLAYSELFFTNTPWPEFTSEEFIRIYNDIRKRDRRFGSIQEGLTLYESVKKARERSKSHVQF